LGEPCPVLFVWLAAVFSRTTTETQVAKPKNPNQTNNQDDNTKQKMKMQK
jgi:hypothetical protein